MALLSSLIEKGIKLRESIHQEYSTPLDLQKEELKQLLISARNTAFGKHYHFKNILNSFRDREIKLFYQEFKRSIPIYNYTTIFNDWWKKSLDGEKDVCWPGKVKYFALSSGTSEASSKYLPVTKKHHKAIQRTSIRQLVTLYKYDLPSKLFAKGILMLGGSTDLNKKGHFFEGDLSGIQTAHLPFWFQHFFKPGKKIAKTRDWDEKLDEIVRNASQWDIGFLVGVPAWIQILMEKIIDHYQIDNIHDIWPDLSVYVHGGVSFDPYRKGFEKLLGKPVYYIETYLASEGFIAFQSKPNTHSMKMVLNNGLFYEFVPFNDQNIDENGEVKQNAQTLMIDEIEEEVQYALLLSSCAGAWRYMIGDVIKFTSKQECEIVITGRTKHFLSLCGEHLSVENMNRAIELVGDDLNININEFAVAGVPHKSLFAHHWFIGTDDDVDKDEFREKLDNHLKDLNDDYKVERKAALKDVIVDVLPNHIFIDFLAHIGKKGGQNKFPRVLKGKQLVEWEEFIKDI